MSDDMQKQLLARLDALASKLGIAGRALWQIYVRQAKITGIECLVAGLVALSLSAWLWMMGRRLMKKEVAGEESTGICMWGFIPSIGLLALSIMFMIDSFDLLANPPFWAFKAIVETVR